MKDEFREGQVSGQDPMDGRQQDFDWDFVYSSLGEQEVEVESVNYETLARALRIIFQWLLKVRWYQIKGDSILGRRLLALVWTIDPGLVKGLSLARIARFIHCNKENISWHAAQAHRDFGVRNRGQSKGWNFSPDGRKRQKPRPPQGSTHPTQNVTSGQPDAQDAPTEGDGRHD